MGIVKGESKKLWDKPSLSVSWWDCRARSGVTVMDGTHPAKGTNIKCKPELIIYVPSCGHCQVRKTGNRSRGHFFSTLTCTEQVIVINCLVAASPSISTEGLKVGAKVTAVVVRGEFCFEH